MTQLARAVPPDESSPRGNLADHVYAQLKADLTACGFFSWCDDEKGDKEGSKFPSKA